MKYLVLALVLCALLSLSNAYCHQTAIEPGATRCQDDVDGTWHDVGTSWRNSRCMDCSCSGCCTAYSIPRDFPEDCVSELDLQACEYKVYRRDDPTVSCPIFSAVGK